MPIPSDISMEMECDLWASYPWRGRVFSRVHVQKKKRDAGVRLASTDGQPPLVTKLQRRQRGRDDEDVGVLAADSTNTSTVYALGIKGEIYDSSFAWIVYRFDATLTGRLPQ